MDHRLPWVALGLVAVMSGCGSTGGAGLSGMSGAAGSAAGNAAGSAAGGTAGSGAHEGVAGAGASGAASLAGGAGTSEAGGTSAGAAGSSGGAGGERPFYPLGMNDVTILAPLPASLDKPVLLRATDLADDGSGLVPQALVDRLLGSGPFGEAIATFAPVYGSLHLVAVRFDLCDRHLPGACPEAEDARMRLVFQPLLDPPRAQDVGFHAFYSIRNDEISGAVAALRKLATLAPAQTGPLGVSLALGAADPEPYANQLRAFVRRYGGEARLVRLTMNALDLKFSALVWSLRGLEKKGTVFSEMTIPGTTEMSGEVAERVTLTGNPGYDTAPNTDTPAGLRVALSQLKFDAADPTNKRTALAALAAVESPLTATAETVACVGCHVSTVVMSARNTSSAIDPLTLPGRYTSKFDLATTGGKSAQTPTTLRALGYLGQQPMISQRVVNDTAQALTEIEQRFPQ